MLTPIIGDIIVLYISYLVYGDTVLGFEVVHHYHHYWLLYLIQL